MGNTVPKGSPFAIAGEGGGAVPSGLTDLAAVPIEEILRYDATAFPAPRAEFLMSWIAQPRAVALDASLPEACVATGP